MMAGQEKKEKVVGSFCWADRVIEVRVDGDTVRLYHPATTEPVALLSWSQTRTPRHHTAIAIEYADAAETYLPGAAATPRFALQVAAVLNAWDWKRGGRRG